MPLARSIHHLTDLAAVLLGATLNALLVLVVHVEKRGALRGYATVVTMNCLVDFMLVFTTVISEIQVDVQGGVMFFVPSSYIGGKIQTQLFHTVLTYVWSVGLGFSILFQPVPFYHRYQTIVNNVMVSKRKLLLVMLYPVVCCLWNTTWMSVSLGNSMHERDRLQHLLNFSTWQDPNGDVTLFVPIELTSIATWVFCMSCAITFPLATLLSLCLMGRVKSALAHARCSMSSRTALLHKQLNNAMLCQLILPCLFGVFPLVYGMSLMFLRTGLPTVTIFVSALIAWVPVINPVVNFMVVRPYRLCLKDMVKHWTLRTRVYSAHSANISTTTSVIHRF